MNTKNKKIHYSCSSSVGLVRHNNQDNFICDGIYMNNDTNTNQFSIAGTAEPDSFHLFGVFDGLGGEECGEVAAYIAASEAALLPASEMQAQGLKQYCTRANQKICQYAEENNLYSIGTTAALLALSKKEIYICNIGDSKVFQFDGVTLSQISVDHLSWAPVGKRQPLSQNLGVPEDLMVIEPYINQVDFIPGNVFVLCSDGLTDMLSLETIWQVLKETEIEKCSGKLVELALKNGGNDNVTVLVVKI